MTAKAIPRHARTSERQRWVPHPRAGRLHRAWAPGIAQPRPPEGPMSADPLAGPVAITQRAVLGDQIRRPTAWCEMAACISRYDDSAALGEADIRARALGAGWRHDTAGRLICPYCQRRRPALQAASPVAGHDNPPGRGPGPQTSRARTGGISALWSALPAWHRRLLGGQHLPPRWLRLLAALVRGRNGWNTPPSGPAAGALGRLRSAGPDGPSHSSGHRPAATPPAQDGADDHRRQQSQWTRPGREAALRRARRHTAHRQFRLPRRRHPLDRTPKWRAPASKLHVNRARHRCQRAGDSCGGQVRRDASTGLIRPTSLPSGSATIA